MHHARVAPRAGAGTSTTGAAAKVNASQACQLPRLQVSSSRGQDCRAFRNATTQGVMAAGERQLYHPRGQGLEGVLDGGLVAACCSCRHGDGGRSR